MCGIAGIWRGGDADLDLPVQVGRMCDAIAHRGPDDAGVWVDPTAGVGLGFRRLAIIDLSANGHQPMRSACGRYTLVFNGEAYNYLSLRVRLEGEGAAPAWRGSSDTEVVLAAIAAWGIERALLAVSGMFALALWDSRERVLHLARDRFGEKPLYYGWAGQHLVFGSELKALRACPGFDRSVDRQALAAYLRHVYVPAPASIYASARKLPAGHLLSIRAEHRDRLEPAPYWPVASLTLVGTDRAAEGELLDRLDATLRVAVRRQMVADVPLGAFLSGGIDSSLVVALMQAQSARPAHTFTIGNQDPRYDEAPIAREVARHLGTHHTELYVSPQDALEVVPLLPTLYDEPFADSSQIPTYLVAKLARQHVTVSLSGDGGDELFGGYNRYFHGRRVAAWISRLPLAARTGVAALLTTISPVGWDALASALAPLLPRELADGRSGDKLHKLARLLRVAEADRLHDALLSEWTHPWALIQGEPQPELAAPMIPSHLTDAAARMMLHDLIRYLPDDILAKVDRATMGVSLEARAPYLDPEVAALAWSLPLDAKLGGARGKLPLRRLLARYLPLALIERPKQGFGVPVAHWLRDELKPWAEHLLDTQRLAREGYLRPEPIRRAWDEHQAGTHNREHRLWAVLMFQAWLEAGGDRA
jgi:asparagine synthase (glutamine-hydrolysing)